MKQISKKRHNWLLRRELRISKKLKKIARHEIPGEIRKCHIIPLPQIICAIDSNNRAMLLKCLRSIIDLSESSDRVKIDFSRVKLIRPAGMLMLLAFLESLRDWGRRLQIRCPQGSLSAQLMQLFGIASRFGVSTKNNQPRHSAVLGWQYKKGHRAEGDKIGTILKHYRSQFGLFIPENLYDAVLEALTNVVHHAYPDNYRSHEEDQRWWMFAKLQPANAENEGHLIIAVYDMGVGIVESLKTKLNLYERLQDATSAFAQLFGATSSNDLDGKLLVEAIEHGRTSTKLPFRGKGLPEMLEFAASTTDGEMTVLTGSSLYTYSARHAEGMVSRCEIPIGGTLISWYVPLHRNLESNQ